ncbi:MAG: acyltransferase [Mesorhizobium sp.]|nr:MAG: acyltransferase [Mesorhizobium sp.]
MIATPPLVFVGLISYSLYLWHWPFIVFSQYYLVRDLNIGEIMIAGAGMAICAIVSWRYVERPFRSRAISARSVCLAAAAGASVLAAIASALIWSNGLPGRISGEAAAINAAVGTNYRCPVSNFLRIGQSRACVLNLPSRNPSDAKVVLLGNSHVQMYAPVWESIFIERELPGLLVPANGCLPTVSVNITRECIDVAAGNLHELGKLSNAKTVIVGLTWTHAEDGLVDANGKTVDNRDDAELVRGLDDLIGRMHGLGKKVVLIGPIAYPGWDLPSELSRDLAFGRSPEKLTYLPAEEFQRQYGAIIQHFENRNNIGFARPDTALCDASRCNYVVDRRSIFADASHIAKAELFRFRAIFSDALATQR